MGRGKCGSQRRRCEVNDNGSKSLLAMAIEREDWELAALCLALGVLKAAEDLPQETLDALLARGVEMLTRAVATQYRLSPKARDDLADSLAAVFNSFGDHILPPDR